MTNKLIFSAVGLMIAYGIISNSDYEEELSQEEHYCAMRKIWENSKGIPEITRPGWPNFNPEVECNL
jgi:hypothetical protein